MDFGGEDFSDVVITQHFPLQGTVGGIYSGPLYPAEMIPRGKKVT